MSWPFCGNCGNILDPPVGNEITCDFCGLSCPFSQVNTGEIITYSAIRSRPAWLGDETEESTTTVGGKSATRPASKSSSTKKASKHATIEEPCPKCGHPELYFYTMQLRSVDEGSTVFYECPKCAHTYSQNN